MRKEEIEETHYELSKKMWEDNLKGCWSGEDLNTILRIRTIYKLKYENN